MGVNGPLCTLCPRLDPAISHWFDRCVSICDATRPRRLTATVLYSADVNIVAACANIVGYYGISCRYLLVTINELPPCF